MGGLLAPAAFLCVGGLLEAEGLRIAPIGFGSSLSEEVSAPVLPLSCWR